MDFPYDLTNPNKHIIGSLNSTGPLMDLAITTNNVATSGAVWPAANRALYQPVMVETWFLAQVMAVQVTATAAGNFDVGIFDSFGRKLVSMAKLLGIRLRLLQPIRMSGHYGIAVGRCIRLARILRIV